MQTIVIVEDEKSIREMYSVKLKASGYQVYVAANGVEGLKVIKETEPDLILLDLLMPEMNGEEMLTILRDEDWGERIKVFILTNISKTEAPSSLRLLNIERYVVKVHHTPKQIVEMIEEVLA